MPIPVGICNKRTGLHCNSTFLKDINGQTKYEGTFIFSIFSTSDEKVSDNDYTKHRKLRLNSNITNGLKTCLQKLTDESLLHY